MSRVGADILERASITVVGVDAADLSTVASCGALDIDVALALARALIQKKEKKLAIEVNSDTVVGTEGRNGLLTFPHDR